MGLEPKVLADVMVLMLEALLLVEDGDNFGSFPIKTPLFVHAP